MVRRSTYRRIAQGLPFSARQERLAVIYVGPRGVRQTEWTGAAGNGTVQFDVAHLVRRAQGLGATGLVLVHNHPSGSPRPSAEDVAVTRRVWRAATDAGLTLHDHLVVARGRVHSIGGKQAGRVKGCGLCSARVSDVPHRTMDHRREAHTIAREIRQEGEKYSHALKRAWQQIKDSPHWRQTRPEPPPKGTAPPEKVRAAVKKVALERRTPPIQRRAAPPEPPPTRQPPARRPLGLGDTTTATGPDPRTVYELRYRVLPMEAVKPSHTDALEPNPGYPKEIQPRLRDRAASRMQIRTMAQNLDPRALVVDYHTLDRGPMIVGPDFAVESGNGRTLALRLARQEFPDRYRAYVELLREMVGRYGIRPEDLRKIRDPVLVRQRLTDVDRVEFAEAANATTAMAMSPLETALTDARKLSDEALASLEVGETQTVDQALQSPANKGLVAGFLAALPANERAALVDQAGRLNQVGLQRLKAAMFAKVYPGDAGMRLTRAFVESLDPTLKNVEAAMFDSLPQMARAEALVRSGQRVADLSIGQDLARVVDRLASLKAQRMTAEDFVRQASFVGRDLSPTEEKVLVHLDQFGRSRKAIREFLRGYADAVTAAPHPQQGAMFAGAQESKGDIVSRLIEGQSQRAASGALWDLIEARERAGLVADPGRRYPRWSRVGSRGRRR